MFEYAELMRIAQNPTCGVLAESRIRSGISYEVISTCYVRWEHPASWFFCINIRGSFGASSVGGGVNFISEGSIIWTSGQQCV
jgi:hypothetical protein